MKVIIQRIVIVLPAFNEEIGLKAILGNLKQIMENNGLDYIVIVVNDGSTDNTSSIIESYKGAMPIILLDHGNNRGIGKAFLTGFKKAAEITNPDDIIILMEADNTSEVKISKDIIDKINGGLDIVCASRYIEGGGYLNFPIKRLFFSKWANALLKIIFPIGNLKDYTIFYRAYRAKILKDAFKKYGDSFIECPGFAANVEILMKLRRFHPRIGEVPFRYDYSFKKGPSKMHLSGTIFDYLHLFCRIKDQRLSR